jgi:hypothetical protein
VDSAELHTEQPMPTVNDSPSVQSMVIADLQVRLQVGISRYGTGLQPFNGRDGLRDLYEELLDAATYIRQVIAERDQLAALPKRCLDCGRTARELIAVLDPAGKLTGWVGPTCKRRRDEAASRGAGVQLPLAEGADRG